LRFSFNRFGARSGFALLKGFLLLVVISAALMHGTSPATIPLLPGFVAAYVIVAICQWLSSQRNQPTEQIHSYSSGEPWPLWEQIPVDIIIIERYLEPVTCCLIGLAVLIFDGALARWLFLAALTLFVKGQVGRARRRTRQLDGVDNKIEAEHRAPRPHTENEAFVEARLAPPPPARRRGR
jgi:hypothetical protein